MLSKQRRKLIQDFLKQKQISENKWHCCNQDYDSIAQVGRHVDQTHQQDLDQLEQQLTEKKQQTETLKKLTQRRGEKGSSDPITIENCHCQPDTSRVVLFYRYAQIEQPEELALEHHKRCKNMTGKVRIGAEGINATLAGDKKDIIDYLDWLITTQAFGELQEGLAGNDLDDKSSAQYKFFKPTVGCAHVFSELSIKLVDEICPLGQSSVVLDKLSMNNHRKGKLSPEAFHALLEKKDDYVLLDTRNYYESKIGHFDGAIQPAIRKFSQFPEYIDRNKDALEGKKILTYCTGGIRCEKATAYMRQALPDTEIFMLDGGIHNYMEWWNQKEEIKDKVLWHGKNYIFDARQSLGLENGEVVGQCQFCGIPWDTYSKCSSQGCHLLVLCCDHCKANQSAIFCCTECENGGTNGLCHCEKQRRLKEVEPLGHM